MSGDPKKEIQPAPEPSPQQGVLGTSYSPAECAEQGRAAAIEAGQRIAQEVAHPQSKELHAPSALPPLSSRSLVTLRLLSSTRRALRTTVHSSLLEVTGSSPSRPLSSSKCLFPNLL